MMYGGIGAESTDFNVVTASADYGCNVPLFHGHWPTLSIPTGPPAALRADQRAARRRTLRPLRPAMLVLPIGSANWRLSLPGVRVGPPGPRLGGIASRLSPSCLPQLPCPPGADDRGAVHNGEEQP